ncbi:MAG: hypothetical protein IKJ77_02545 [Firmicutes bacterium]|nr:hypothetical protein [Bacillota bacterium]
MEKNLIIDGLLKQIKGELAVESQEARRIAEQAYEMGQNYAQTKRFDNSRFYHNYRFRLDDGTSVMSSNFFNIFMSRNQTPAYMEAEKALRGFFDDADQTIFRMVRDKRNGINGAFKAVMSPKEPQQLNFVDFVLVIACFCAGAVNK